LPEDLKKYEEKFHSPLVHSFSFFQPSKHFIYFGMNHSPG